MRSISLTVALVLPLLAGGCAGRIEEMATWVGFDEYADEALVVLGISTPASVLLAPGRIHRNGWGGRGPTAGRWLSARDGFVVAKVAPTQDDAAYAIIQVRPDRFAAGKDATAPTYETGFWPLVPGNVVSPPTTGDAQGAAAPAGAGERPAYGPAGEARVPVLAATAGRVAFAGTIRIDPVRASDTDETPQKVGITPVVSPDDLAAVGRFMAEHYPKVTARIVPRPLQMMRRTQTGD
jgi:hypothetical protein